MNIGSRITALRKEKGWSQTDLGKKAEVSREIIGRYERDDVLPSIEVAKKIADAFDVSLDYLAGEGENAMLDRDVVKRIEDIQSLKPDIKDKLFYIIDTCIRDAKTQQAYGL